jgi:hypothetical protein
MRLIWTVEKNASIVLRDPKQAARALVQRCSDASGFIAVILEPGMPNAGPYRLRIEAAEFAQAWIKRELFPDAEFGGIPIFSSEETRPRKPQLELHV